MSLIAEFGKLCEQAARVGGQVIRDHAGRVQAREKNPADLVTDADVASQRAISDTLLGVFPHHGFLAEENESIPPGAGWLALDRRSTRWHHEFRAWHPRVCRFDRAGATRASCWSVCVYDPVTRRMLSRRGRRGGLSERPAAPVSRTVETSKAVVAVSFPPRTTASSRPRCGGFSRFWKRVGQHDAPVRQP